MKKLGDWAIALTVLACSIVLLLALAFALEGNPFSRPSRTLRVQLVDMTGLQSSSAVKFSGAPAGVVQAVRILSPEERAASAHPENAVELTLAINPGVPPFTEGLVASIASDTLLSDKFMLLSGGDPRAATLPNGALIPSVRPVTFDELLRDLGGTLSSLQKIFGGLDGQAVEGILPKLDQLLGKLDATVGQAQTLLGHGETLVTSAGGLVRNGDELVANAGTLVNDTRGPLKQLLADLTSAADSLESLAQRLDRLVRENEDNINATAVDAKDALAALKATAIETRALVESLRQRPQQLIWGPGRPRPTPTPAR